MYKKRKPRKSKINKNFILDNALSNIKVSSVDFRTIYTDSMKFNYGNNNPIEIGNDKLDRLMVNTIRHNYTNYDETLKKINKINDSKNSYYKMYKNAVLNNISESYPSLCEECDNQKYTMPMVKINKK